MHILVVSPVPTHPPDKGNGARIYHVTRLLQTLGHVVHFLYYAMEGLSDWQRREMASCWDFLHVVPHSIRTDVRSKGELYDVDDWYEEALGAAVARLHERWRYGACVVNYVWQSRALLALPHDVIKIIDTHDVFGDRHLRARERGIEPNWIYMSVDDERIGLARADIVLAIQDEEARYFRSLGLRDVRVAGHLAPPNYVAAARPETPIRVGYVASDNVWNMTALRALESKLAAREEVRRKCAFVLAGSACDAPAGEHRVFERLGRVDDLAAFHADVDVRAWLGGTRRSRLRDGCPLALLELVQGLHPPLRSSADSPELRALPALTWCAAQPPGRYAAIDECLSLQAFLNQPARTNFTPEALGITGEDATLRSVLTGGRTRTPSEAAQRLRRLPRRPRTPGLNVVGHVRADIGVGEDARVLSFACEAVAMPHVLVDVDPGSTIPQGDTRGDHRLGEDLCYETTVFCMTALSTASHFLRRGRRAFRAPRNVGYWPWELASWPEHWRIFFELVDEVWCMSRFVQSAVRAATDLPAPLIPPAVVLGPVAPLSRIDFGLPAGRFVFCFAFDTRSYTSRKNPGAVLRAFARAFPRGDEAVGLVVKINSTAEAAPIVDAIRAMAARDTRVVVIDEVLPRPALLALYAACDCFVSLHRSEGFGRSIAEAMLLGLSVIATGYSGNVDYAASGHRTRLVRYAMAGVAADAYPEAAGQTWADPDLDDAAAAMREAQARGSSRVTKLPAGTFSVERLGAAIRTHCRS